jgi:hypothetical protein
LTSCYKVVDFTDFYYKLLHQTNSIVTAYQLVDKLATSLLRIHLVDKLATSLLRTHLVDKLATRLLRTHLVDKMRHFYAYKRWLELITSFVILFFAAGSRR